MPSDRVAPPDGQLSMQMELTYSDLVALYGLAMFGSAILTGSMEGAKAIRDTLVSSVEPGDAFAMLEKVGASLDVASRAIALVDKEG